MKRIHLCLVLMAGELALSGCSKENAAPTQPPAAPTLEFSVPPGDRTAGTPFAPDVQVRVVDASGNTVTTFTGSITVAISANPQNGTLAGQPTVAATNGVATFPDLSIDQSASGYTLEATAGGTTSATSPSFAILSGPSSMVVVAGNNQSGPVSAPVSVDPAVRLADVHGKPAVGVTVIFFALGGGGSVQGGWTYTDANGVARPRQWTLGPLPGVDTVLALYSGPALTGSPAVFTAMGLAATPTQRRAPGTSIP